MGSGISIYIQLHKDRGQNETNPVTAGTVLQGKVIVELNSPLYLLDTQTPTNNIDNSKGMKDPNEILDTIDLSLLTLRIYGKEKVQMNLSSARKRARNKGHQTTTAPNTPNPTTTTTDIPYPVKAERKFFDVTLPLREFPKSAYNISKNCIERGFYQFPFQVQLPVVLPASNSYNPSTRLSHGTDKAWFGKRGFRIQYKMYVILHSVTKRTLDGSVYSTPPQHLWIQSAPKDSIHVDPVPSMVLPLPHELQTSHGWWTQGTVLTAAAVDDTVLCRSVDGSLDLHIACRNNSRTDIQRVQLYLVETIRWGTVPGTSGGANNDAILQEENNLILFALKDVVLPSLGKEKVSLLQSVAQNVLGTKTSTEKQLLKSIYDDLKSDASKLSINLPLNSLARDSYSGQLFQVSHHIEVHFLTDQNLKSNNPTIVIPMRMVNGDQTKLEVSHSFYETINELNKPEFVAATGLMDDNEIAVPSSSSAQNPMYQEESIEATSVKVPTNGHPTNHSSTQQPVEVVSPNDVNRYYGLVPMTVADEHSISLGCAAVDLSELEPMAPPTVTIDPNAPPSLHVLLTQMKSAVDAYDIVLNKMNSPEWIRFFETLSPYEFGQVIANVPDPFDQPRIATLIGNHVNRRRNSQTNGTTTKLIEGLTCEYIAFAIRNTSEVHRATTAMSLLPMCVDAATEYAIVCSELNEWEQTVIASTLETAMIETMPKANVGGTFFSSLTNSPKKQNTTTTTTTTIKPMKTAVPC